MVSQQVKIQSRYNLEKSIRILDSRCIEAISRRGIVIWNSQKSALTFKYSHANFRFDFAGYDHPRTDICCLSMDIPGLEYTITP